MNPGKIRKTAVLTLVAFVYQLGACPCGCLEENYWYQSLRKIADLGSSNTADGQHSIHSVLRIGFLAENAVASQNTGVPQHYESSITGHLADDCQKKAEGCEHECDGTEVYYLTQLRDSAETLAGHHLHDLVLDQSHQHKRWRACLESECAQALLAAEANFRLSTLPLRAELAVFLL